MKMQVKAAREIAATLTLAADAAMAEGKHEFDLTETVKSLDDAARDDLQRAIDAAKQGGEAQG